MKTFDVVIIGAGLAGLQCAKLLSQHGVKILLVDRKHDISKGVHTTGIFVRKTFEDFDFPIGTLSKPISSVTLYSPKLKSFNLKSEKDEFRIGNMGLLYKASLQECLENGVEFLGGARYVSSHAIDDTSKTLVKFEKQSKEITAKTKVLIGADGAKSNVARDLNLDENKEWIVGYEEVYQGVPDEPHLHCFLNAKLAPGYLAWIANDGVESHIGVGGYTSRFNPREAYKVFNSKVAPYFIDLENSELKETRGGRIPVGGILKRIANERGLLIGDAAGAVSPLTAGGLDPCMRLSKFAAEIVLERLKSNEAKVLLKYSGEMFRQKFATRLLMRWSLRTFSYQPLLEFAFKFLRIGIGRKFAEKVFFRRASFPNVKKLKIEKFSQESG